MGRDGGTRSGLMASWGALVVLSLTMFVLLALIAALFLPKGKLADVKHPPDETDNRYDKGAPYPERGT